MQAFVTLRATANWPGLREQRERRVKNGLLDVSQHAHWLRLRLLLSGNHAWQDTIDGLAAATADDVASHRARVLDGCHLEALVEGNVSAERATSMCRHDAQTHCTRCTSGRIPLCTLRNTVEHRRRDSASVQHQYDDRH